LTIAMSVACVLIGNCSYVGIRIDRANYQFYQRVRGPGNARGGWVVVQFGTSSIVIPSGTLSEPALYFSRRVGPRDLVLSENINLCHHRWMKSRAKPSAVVSHVFMRRINEPHARSSDTLSPPHCEIFFFQEPIEDHDRHTALSNRRGCIAAFC